MLSPLYLQVRPTKRPVRHYMHWVDRGPEPGGLAQIRLTYTSRWVRYYSHRIGNQPADSHWLRFHPDLTRVFAGLCAYCEEVTKGEVDHFRPKSRFPRLVYSWSNWLLACHECNHAKLSTWPVGGYVDPCSRSGPGVPESCLVFDVPTGFISPNRTLNRYHRVKAQRTIDDLGLNDLHHLKKRVEWLELFSAAMPEDPDGMTAHTRQTLVHFSSRERHLSSLVRAWLSQWGYTVAHRAEYHEPT